MDKSKTPQEDYNDIFHRKIEVLKKQIEPYKEYNWDNLMAISKHAIKLFSEEEILEHWSYPQSLGFYLENHVVRPHFKIRKNKMIPLINRFYSAFLTTYFAIYHRDELIAAQKKHDCCERK